LRLQDQKRLIVGARALPRIPRVGAAAVQLGDLRRYAVARTLLPPADLQQALDRLGFVQADPIRAPARAQDLTLRHRVANYRAGDLERRYRQLDVHEDFFVNYGFVTSAVSALMHPRGGPTPWSAARGRHVKALLAFVREHGEVHPREVDEHFALGSVTNYWGGSSSATTHLLDQMHYRGLLRVVRRDSGIRVYAAHEHPPVLGGLAARRERLDALVDVVVSKYAPLTASGLNRLVKRLRYGVPQWATALNRAVLRAKHRLSHARVDGVDWYWPAGEEPAAAEPDDAARLLAPFDPIVWDRPRFELLWGWEYRFEAYTPVPKRKLGYYALPLLWRADVVGWANVTTADGEIRPEVRYVPGRPPRERAFAAALEDELSRLAVSLGLTIGRSSRRA
jgi:uncharacterized protein